MLQKMFSRWHNFTLKREQQTCVCVHIWHIKIHFQTHTIVETFQTNMDCSPSAGDAESCCGCALCCITFA